MVSKSVFRYASSDTLPFSFLEYFSSFLWLYSVTYTLLRKIQLIKESETLSFCVILNLCMCVSIFLSFSLTRGKSRNPIIRACLRYNWIFLLKIPTLIGYWKSSPLSSPRRGSEISFGRLIFSLKRRAQVLNVFSLHYRYTDAIDHGWGIAMHTHDIKSSLTRRGFTAHM